MTADARGTPLERFAALLAPEPFPLFEACLAIAEDTYPDLDPARSIAALDAMATTIRSRVAADAFAEQRIAALNHHLFEELGFRGNEAAYDDPRNSYLNDVIERRTGIPITLSVVYIELGRRIGLAVEGVGFPGHFVVRARVRRGALVLDPFSRGVPLSEAALRDRLARAIGPTRAAEEPLAPWLQPAAPREIVARMLRNLKAIHLAAKEDVRALAVLDRMLMLTPDAADVLRDRGLAYRRLDCFRPALADLQAYLTQRPDAADAGEIHALAVELGRQVARLN